MKEEITKPLYQFIVLIAVGVPINIWQGFVACKLWNWFLAPAFNIAAPSLILMAGLCMLARFVCATAVYKKNEEVYMGGTISFAIIYPAVILLSGWLLSLFV